MSTAFVTGANKGIGFALAEELLKANFRVIIGVRDFNLRAREFPRHAVG